MIVYVWDRNVTQNTRVPVLSLKMAIYVISPVQGETHEAI